MDSLKVFAPATLSNLAVGFDILALAVENMGDEIIIRKGGKKGITITDIHGNDGKLSYDVNNNIAGYAAQGVLNHLGEPDMPLQIKLFKNMKIGTGLGSSAASAVAGVMAVNELLNQPLSKKELLPIALSAERINDPTLPADNVAASLIGGIVSLQDKSAKNFRRLPSPRSLGVVVIFPHVTSLTIESRKQLNKDITLDQHITQSGNLSMFISSLYTSDFDLLKDSLFDCIIEPQRKSGIPFYDDLKEIAMSKGALGFNISGSGPSMFAFINNSLVAENIKEAVTSFLSDKKLEHDCFISNINHLGAVRC